MFFYYRQPKIHISCALELTTTFIMWTRAGYKVYRLNLEQHYADSENRWVRAGSVGSVLGCVYFPIVDTLTLSGLQVTPEVRARTRLQFPSSCNVRGNSPRTEAENASAAPEIKQTRPIFIDLQGVFSSVWMNVFQVNIIYRGNRGKGNRVRPDVMIQVKAILWWRRYSYL